MNKRRTVIFDVGTAHESRNHNISYKHADVNGSGYCGNVIVENPDDPRPFPFEIGWFDWGCEGNGHFLETDLSPGKYRLTITKLAEYTDEGNEDAS